jgi:arsenate reductase
VVKKVLFLSSANSVRSQMAEGFLRILAGDAYEAFSAGTAPCALDPLAIAVMAQHGIDITKQRPQGLQEFMGKAQFDYVITVCDRTEKDRPLFPGRGAREFWPIDDPVGTETTGDERLDRFREARDHIEARVRRFLVECHYRPVVELSHEGAFADR